MTELAQLLATWEWERAAGRPTALATLVRTQGSSYRSVGARALLGPAGPWVGGISGGCLEQDLTHRAAAIFAGGPAQHVAYDTGAADDRLFGLNLGCGGQLEVLLEPLTPESPALAALQWLEAQRARRRSGVLLTRITGANLGSRWGCTQDETIESWQTGVELDAEPTAELLAAARLWLAQSNETYTWHHDAAGDLLFERVLRPQALWIFGSGFDVDPLVDFAQRLAWEVTVIETRGQLSPGRFAQIPTVVAPIGEALAHLHPDVDTAALVMSHHYDQDLAAIRVLAGLPLGYLGLLGPRHRSEKMLGELRGELRDAGSATDFLAKVRYPVGLDLGADTPEKVALAILGEILALQKGRLGGFLRDRLAPIHANQRHD